MRTNQCCMNEASTRAEKIDPILSQVGWETDPSKGVKVWREFPMNQGMLLGSGGKRKKTIHADYVLEYRGKRLAVVEAKSVLKYTLTKPINPLNITESQILETQKTTQTENNLKQNLTH